MKKIILTYDENRNIYSIGDDLHVTRNFELHYVYRVLNPPREYHIRIEVDNLKELDAIRIHSFDSIKNIERDDDDYNDPKKRAARNIAHSVYQRARMAEIPKVTISKQDWQNLQEQWKLIKKDLPKYIVITSDEAQPLQKVEIIGKNELSQQDVDDIKKENEKYLKFEEAHNKFLDDHPDIHYYWRGPQDNELDADIMKYYED